MADNVVRVSSLDTGYTTGGLSVFPEQIDNKDTLYEAKNNAESPLKHSLAYNGRNIILEDASAFPDSGLIRVGQIGSAFPYELVYYAIKNGNVLTGLMRGFAGSRQNGWPGKTTFASSSVMAEHHNSVKDALLNVEKFLGVKSNPDATSLNGILSALETRFLTPQASFRAYPLSGPPGTSVRFQDFSEGNTIRYLWDFGDGTTSIEKNPSKVYQQEGTYSVKLNIITSTGGQGVCTKNNYVTIDEKEKKPFFYVVNSFDDPLNFSISTAQAQTQLGDPSDPQVFEFIDQTDADIVQRYWIFDDGVSVAVSDPDVHTITHQYEKPGKYQPSLLIVYADQRLKRVFLSDEANSFLNVL